MSPLDLNLELAWAAGFFDGEGSVSVISDRRPGRLPKVALSIEQVDARPLRRFAEAVEYKNVSLRPARTATRQPIHRICMGDIATRRTMCLLWPWLSEPKREQYQQCLDRMEELRATATP